MLVARHQFTVEAYHRMHTAGIFTEDDRLELLQGQVVRMNLVGPRHAAIVKRLNTLLNQQVAQRYIVSVQDPIQLSAFSEPQPDVALLAYRADYYAMSHPQAHDVLLLIEVSDTSLEYDRMQKLPLYADAQIAEVWIIDLEQQQVEQYCHPANGLYRTKQTWLPGQMVTGSRIPTLSLSVDDILGS